MSKTKRILAIIMVIICCFVCCIGLTGCRVGAGDEWENEAETTDTPQNLNGHWELKSKKAEPNRDIIGSSSKSIYKLTQTSHSLDYTYDDEPDVMNGEHFSGQYVITCTDLPNVFNVGDTISVTLNAKALSYTNTTRYMSLTGKMLFQSDLVLGFDTEDPLDSEVCAGSDGMYVPAIFNAEDSITYTRTLKKDYAGKIKTFWVVFQSSAGESVWEYDWVEDK